MTFLIFAGREHHAQKLSNIYNGLSNAKWVIADNSINIDPSTEFIYPYGEFIHANDYLPDDEILPYDFSNVDMEKLLSNIPPFWVFQAMREASELTVSFRKLLEKESPTGVMVLHANNFFCRILAYTAKEMGIKTYAYQEGILRDRDQLTVGKQTMAADYIDTLFTWSTSDKDKYVNAGIKGSNIVPVGPFHLDKYIIQRKDPKLVEAVRQQMGFDSRPIVTFSPPISNRYEGDISKAVSILHEFCKKNNLQFVLRPHPFDKIKGYGDIRVFNEINPYYLFMVSNVVVTQQSTTAIESLMLGTPLAQVDFDNVGILEALETPTITNQSELTILSDIINNPNYDSINNLLKNTLCDGRSTMRVLEYINENS